MKEIRHLETIKNKRNSYKNGSFRKTIKMEKRLCCIDMMKSCDLFYALTLIPNLSSSRSFHFIRALFPSWCHFWFMSSCLNIFAGRNDQPMIVLSCHWLTDWLTHRRYVIVAMLIILRLVHGLPEFKIVSVGGAFFSTLMHSLGGGVGIAS